VLKLCVSSYNKTN